MSKSAIFALGCVCAVLFSMNVLLSCRVDSECAGDVPLRTSRVRADYVRSNQVQYSTQCSQYTTVQYSAHNSTHNSTVQYTQQYSAVQFAAFL